MSPEIKFIVIFLTTVISTRLFLYFWPISGPTVKSIRIHHYHFGLVILLIALAAKNVPYFALGLGLFVDETTFLITRGKSHEDNYSVVSIAGTAIISLLVTILSPEVVRLVIR